MGVKIRTRLLKGATIKPLLRYVTGFNFVFTPLDVKGNKQGLDWFRRAINVNDQITTLKQPVNYKSDQTLLSSYMTLKFVNGWEHSFLLRTIKPEMIHNQIRVINKQIEFERMVDQDEDEPEDEYMS